MAGPVACLSVGWVRGLGRGVGGEERRGAGGKTERRERRGLWIIGLGPDNSTPWPKKAALQALSRCRWVQGKTLGFTSPPSRFSCYKVVASHTLAPPPHQLLFVLPQPPRRDQVAVELLPLQPPPCRTRRERWWTSTSPGSARPPTGSSRPRTTPLSRSTLATLMRMASMMVASPPLHFLDSSVLRVMLMAPWTGCGRRRRLRSSSSRCC